MSEYELLVRDALDARVPLRLDRRPAWDDVLARAGVARSANEERSPSFWRGRRRRLVLVLAVAALGVIVVGSALAALGSGPFGTVTSWLGYSGASDSASSHVFVARPNGTTDRLRRGFLYSWSPDGTRLLVGSATPTWPPELAVDVVRADGSSDVRVIPVLRWPGVVQWSPDGRRIAYDDLGGLYVMDGDGGGARRHLAGSPAPGRAFGAWSWSPDGRQMVYTARDARGRSGIYTVNTTGAPRPGRIDVRPLPRAPRGARVYYRPDFKGAVWSPDGSHIAFQWDDGTHPCCYNRTLYVMRADGSHARRLREGCLESWSPDGSELAVTDLEPTHYDDVRCGDELWVVNMDGTRHRRVATDADVAAVAVTWFPDSSKLAYLTYDNGLIVVHTDGSRRRLVAHSVVGVTPPGHAEWGQPAPFSISPDGSTIAYVGGNGPRAGGDLYLVDADGSHRRLIARASNTTLNGPAWLPVRTP